MPIHFLDGVYMGGSAGEQLRIFAPRWWQVHRWIRWWLSNKTKMTIAIVMTVDGREKTFTLRAEKVAHMLPNVPRVDAQVRRW